MFKWNGEEISEEVVPKVVAEVFGCSAHRVAYSDEDNLVMNCKELEEELLEMQQAVIDISEGEDWIEIDGMSVDREFAIDYVIERGWQIADELEDEKLFSAIYLFEDYHIKED